MIIGEGNRDASSCHGLVDHLLPTRTSGTDEHAAQAHRGPVPADVRNIRQTGAIDHDRPRGIDDMGQQRQLDALLQEGCTLQRKPDPRQKVAGPTQGVQGPAANSSLVARAATNKTEAEQADRAERKHHEQGGDGTEHGETDEQIGTDEHQHGRDQDQQQP